MYRRYDIGINTDCPSTADKCNGDCCVALNEFGTMTVRNELCDSACDTLKVDLTEIVSYYFLISRKDNPYFRDFIAILEFFLHERIYKDF